MPAHDKREDPASPTIVVVVAASGKEYRLKAPFYIGRAEDCEVRMQDEFVSRRHVSILLEQGEWWIRDLGSSNGVYVGDQRISKVAVSEGLTIRLGIRGPEVLVRVLKPVIASNSLLQTRRTVADFAQYYFQAGAEDGSAGEHTVIIRRAFAQVQKKQKRRYGGIVVGLAFLMLCLAAVLLFEHGQVRKQREMAKELFYSMKAMDIDIANLRDAVASSQNQQANEGLKRIEKQRGDMERSYDKYLAGLHIYNPKMSQEDRLVLRVARIFGECELDVPPEFLTEVKKYIKYWQSSGRLERAITRAKVNGYTSTISKEMLAEGLPPQFFYLALQESDFDPYISGPNTRKGIAKGMWQFIPETAVKYGLHVGPLVDLPRPDTLDDRHHYDRATVAAGRYLKDLYATDAQASGLLVMACYNWGEVQVLPLIRSMPLNPRERNFWMLLRNHKEQIPKETYDYVFYIVSAAVIGENPRLFGFNFDDPLQDVTAGI